MQGPLRELNPGPLAPEARIIPLDQAATKKFEEKWGRESNALHTIQASFSQVRHIKMRWIDGSATASNTGPRNECPGSNPAIIGQKWDRNGGVWGGWTLAVFRGWTLEKCGGGWRGGWRSMNLVNRNFIMKGKCLNFFLVCLVDAVYES